MDVAYVEVTSPFELRQQPACVTVQMLLFHVKLYLVAHSDIQKKHVSIKFKEIFCFLKKKKGEKPFKSCFFHIFSDYVFFETYFL